MFAKRPPERAAFLLLKIISAVFEFSDTFKTIETPFMSRKLVFLCAFSALLCMGAGVLWATQPPKYYPGLYDADTGLPLVLGSEYYDKVMANKAIWQLSFEEWFNAPHLTASWFGLRRILEEQGIVPIITHVGDFVGNPTGGMSRGVALANSVSFGFGADLEKLSRTSALKGWTMGNYWSWDFGHDLSKRRIGNSFDVQQAYGDPTLNLSSLFVRYDGDVFSPDWKFMFKAGNFCPDENFLTSPIFWLYQNGAINGNPDGLGNQLRWATGNAWGAVVQVKYKDGQYLKAGVFKLNTDAQDAPDRHGLEFSFNGVGVNANFEAGWEIRHDDTGKSPGLVAVGLVTDWYDAAHFSNPQEVSTFGYSLYVQADYMVWNLGMVKNDEARYIRRSSDRYRDLRGLILWGTAQYNPNDETAKMPFFVNGGLFFNAPIISRADDVACLGFAYGRYSGKLQDNWLKNSHEAMVEMNYKAQINRFAYIQPTVQYVFNPSGGRYPDALVLGVQFGLNL